MNAEPSIGQTSAAMPPDLGAAIATEPLWLQMWVGVLVLSNLAALAFILGKEHGKWTVRPEPIAIILAFVAAAACMEWIYAEYGYVRLLGLGHVLFWTPVYAWIALKRRQLATGAFLKYLWVYLVVAGISLVVDVADVVRYLAGDGQLFQRWAD